MKGVVATVNRKPPRAGHNCRFSEAASCSEILPLFHIQNSPVFPVIGFDAFWCSKYYSFREHFHGGLRQGFHQRPEDRLPVAGATPILPAAWLEEDRILRG